jgi:hypothetical protein
LRFPRFLFNPKARVFFALWKRELRANARLRKELLEWQNKFLLKTNTSPLFTPPAKPVEAQPRPPIGPTEKKAFLAANAPLNPVPTAEEVLAAAAARNGSQ